MPATEREMLASPNGVWPALPQAAWSDSCATLQLWLQVVGKVRLALMPAINHTWNVTLYPTVRGVTTSPMPHGTRMLQIEIDLQHTRAVWHRRSGHTANCRVECDVPGVIDRRHQRQPHFPYNLQPQLQSRAAVAPRRLRQGGPHAIGARQHLALRRRHKSSLRPSYTRPLADYPTNPFRPE